MDKLARVGQLEALVLRETQVPLVIQVMQATQALMVLQGLAVPLVMRV